MHREMAFDLVFVTAVLSWARARRAMCVRPQCCLQRTNIRLNLT